MYRNLLATVWQSASMSGLFLHNEMHKECTNNFKWYPFDNCIGYCKRYCTLKYCVWFFCSNSMSCSYILCTSFCECRFVCHIHRAQKESIHLWMRVATNSIRQIQMHSLKDLVYTVTAYRNECYLKCEHTLMAGHGVYLLWMDKNRHWSNHFQTFSAAAYFGLFAPANIVQPRKYSECLGCLFGTRERDSREKRKQKDGFMIMSFLLFRLWSNDSFIWCASDNCKRLFSCIRHSANNYSVANGWVLFPSLCQFKYFHC